MRIEISKNISITDLESIYGGSIPPYHPPFYIQSRLRDGQMFAARVDTKVAGFLSYTFIWGNCPFVELLKVVPDFQRHGIGRALMDAAKKEIRGMGFKRLISSSEESNPGGQTFHERLGFTRLNTVLLSHGNEVFFGIDL
jgi:GNAT superfamily N-acetyltransferase